jgi:hypothetical protein
LSEIRLVNPSDLLLQKIDNIDNQGNSIKTFFLNADTLALRDGGCMVFVDIEPINQQNQYATRYPYLALVPLIDIYNPCVELVSGAPTLTQITVKRAVIRDGGIQYQWWEYTQGTVTIYEEVNGVIGIKDRRELRNAKGQPLSYIPAVYYTVVNGSLIQPATPPFMALCELNICHLNKESELDAVESKCNSPTPYRRWPSGVPEHPQPLLTGPNRVIEVPQGGEIGFVEPAGTALSITYERQKNREERMDKEARAFLTGGEVERTATEAIIEAGQAKATLSGMAERKRSCSQQIFAIWSDLATPSEVPSAWVEVEEDSLKIPPSSRDVGVIFDGFVQGVYDRDVALAKLAEIGWLPREHTPMGVTAPETTA